MPDKTTPPEGAPPEQTAQGAPGAIIKVPDGRYKIYTALDNSKLVNIATTADSDHRYRAKLYHDNNAPESLWYFRFLDWINVYKIQNEWRNNSDLLLDRDNDNVYARFTVNPSTHEWILKDAGSGFVYIESALPDSKIMDVARSNTVDDAGIIIWPFEGGTNQKFRLLNIN